MSLNTPRALLRLRNLDCRGLSATVGRGHSEKKDGLLKFHRSLTDTEPRSGPGCILWARLADPLHRWIGLSRPRRSGAIGWPGRVQNGAPPRLLSATCSCRWPAASTPAETPHDRASQGPHLPQCRQDHRIRHLGHVHASLRLVPQGHHPLGSQALALSKALSRVRGTGAHGDGGALSSWIAALDGTPGGGAAGRQEGSHGVQDAPHGVERLNREPGGASLRVEK